MNSTKDEWRQSLRDPYLEQVVQDALAPANTPDDPELMANLHQWASGIGTVLADLNGQLASTTKGDRADYDDWRRVVLRIKRRLEIRHAYVKRIAKNVGTLRQQNQYDALRTAVINHRKAVEEAGFEPEQHDLALWAEIGRIDRLGGPNEG